MSVLIKDMEMPKDKAVAVVIHPDGTAYTAEMFAGVCTKYLADCTAVPVPEHGDLIDRDALLDTATIHWSQTTNESCFPIDEIEYAPTIIPKDEVV